MISLAKHYSVYRRDDLPWLERVPDHWDLRRIKTVLRERSERGVPDEPLLAATQTKGVVRKENFENRTVLALKDLDLLKLVRVGDFVISLRSFQGGIEYARDQGIISPAYTVLCPIDSHTHRYLAWLFKSKPFVDSLSLFVTGIRQGQNIDYERLSRSRLPLPPASDRDAIVRFLDHADRRIRRAIRTKKKLIGLLHEQKLAVIRGAVTRGLDPRVLLRPSGIAWLGPLPEHWNIAMLKSELRNLNSRRVPLSATERGSMTDRRYDYYGASGVIDKLDDYLFDDELLLIAEDGANLVLRNLPLAVIARGKFWVNNHAHILKPRRGNIEYFAGLLESIDFKPWITGAAQPKLTQERLMAIRIPVPPESEQEEIAAWIKGQTADSDRGMEGARQEIALLREYRTRLIADVVTGKLDVRKAAARLSDEIDDSEGLEEVGVDETAEEGFEELEAVEA